MEAVRDDMDILSLDADVIDEFLVGKKDLKKTTRKIEIDLVARIRNHGNDPKFVKLGERLEALREKHEQGLITSIEFETAAGACQGGGGSRKRNGSGGRD